MFNINFVKYIINDNYIWEIKNRLNNAYRCGVDGVVDSVSSLLTNFNQNNRTVLINLLSAFLIIYVIFIHLYFYVY